MIKTPESIKVNEPDYKPDAWQEYTLQELGEWVHLLVKRADMRADRNKAIKDVFDAQNYLDMMRARVDEVMDRIIGPKP